MCQYLKTILLTCLKQNICLIGINNWLSIAHHQLSVLGVVVISFVNDSLLYTAIYRI